MLRRTKKVWVRFSYLLNASEWHHYFPSKTVQSGRQPQLHLRLVQQHGFGNKSLQTGFIWHLQATWNAYICIFCPWHAADTEHSPTATHQLAKSLSPTVCKLQVKDGKWPEIGIGENVCKRLRMRKFTLPVCYKTNQFCKQRWQVRQRENKPKPNSHCDSLFSLWASRITPWQWPNTAKDVWRKIHSLQKAPVVSHQSMRWLKVLCFLKYYNEKALQREKILESVHFPLEQKRMLF